MRLTRVRVLAVALLSAVPLGVFAFAPAAAFAYFPQRFWIRNVGSNKCIGMPYPTNAFQTGVPVIQTVCGAYGTVWTSLYYASDARAIENVSNGLCMDASGPYNGWPVLQDYCEALPRELWDWGPDVSPVYQERTVTIKESHSNSCLDLENGQTQNGVPMQVWECNPNTNNQKWVIHSLDQS